MTTTSTEISDNRGFPSTATRPFRRAAVVINPNSGNGKAARQWGALEPEVRAVLGGDCAVFLTEGPEHATRIARDALKDGCDRIVSAGGDGTHHEVVNGFFENDAVINPNAALALLPIGTGSDLRKSLGIPKGRAAIPFLASDRVVPCDIGRMRSRTEDGRPLTRYFVNGLHIGIGGKVGEFTNTGSKAFGGFLTFLIAVLVSRLTYRCLPMDVTVGDRSYSEKMLEIIVSNGQYDGGGIHSAPKAKINDGEFQVTVLKNIGLLSTAINLPLLYVGQQHRHPKCDVMTATHITVDSPHRVLVSPDGEVAGRVPCEIDLIPHAINVVVGPNAPGV